MKIQLNWKLEELSIPIKTNLIQNLYKNKWNSNKTSKFKTTKIQLYKLFLIRQLNLKILRIKSIFNLMKIIH